MPHRLVRWLPAVLAPVVVAGVVAVPLVAAAATPDLSPKTAQQVLELVAKAKDLKGFSGTVSQTSDLGLPSIPTIGAGSDTDTAAALDLLTGDHTAKVDVAGTTQERIAVLDSNAERDVVRDGSSVWVWSYSANTATHVIASGTAKTAKPDTGTPTTPAALASELLTEVQGSSDVSVDATQTVAGRDAYTLVVTPKTSATTIGSVRIAVDAKTGLPLDVKIVARGASSAAFETGFTTISYAVPAASVFDFTPPSGAKVTTKTLTPGTKTKQTKPKTSTAAKPAVAGSGWSSIVTVPAADVPADLASNATVKRLTTAVTGGRVLQTALVNVLLTDDGRVLAGAVPVSQLEAAAG